MSVLRVLGVDPSLRSTGYAIIEWNGARPQVLEAGVITPRASAQLHARLGQLAADLAEIIDGLHPDVMVVEEVFSQTRYPRAAILMAHARGAMLSVAARASLPVHGYTATTVKRAIVGRGGASKDQVARMVTQTLGLRRRPPSADVTDALALAITYARRTRHW